jgi:site-specific DNA-cytosine methylase
MKILVACEYSGRVRDAFTAKGHYAVSCDILPTESPGKHYRGDVRNLLRYKWDMIIAFPPCTKLTTTGVRWFPKWIADGSQQEAIDFFMLFANARAEKVVIENPRGIMSTRFRKPDQYVQPWWFGDPWIKKTGLWLKGVPLLVPSQPVEPLGYWVDGGNYRKSTGRMFNEGAYEGAALKSNGDRAKERSRTFQGLANAMADQWG